MNLMEIKGDWSYIWNSNIFLSAVEQKKNMHKKIYAKHIKIVVWRLEQCMLKCWNRLRLVQLFMVMCVFTCPTNLAVK